MVSIPADTVVVPLASETDAERTADALAAHVPTGGRIVLVHVIEKAGGAPDKASVEQREERAERIFATARDRLGGDDASVETAILYGTDVAGAIVSHAVDRGADLIAFAPRESGRLSRLLTGDTALDLLTDSTVPVLVFPVDGAD